MVFKFSVSEFAKKCLDGNPAIDNADMRERQTERTDVYVERMKNRHSTESKRMLL